ncbi:MAG: phage tail protein [Selenomonas noxia]|nr:phage tail protein [Selenomonas noxia]DAK12799.1 MAG TPA: LONG TAIL FIBER PROTEIN [Bacteriophage sp.]
MAEKTGQFSKSVVTRLGKGMIVESQSGKTVSFTRVVLGDGLIEDGEDIEKLTAIKKERLSCPIRSFVDKGNGQFTLQFEVSNTALEKGFWHREIGVMAKIGAGTEQLYAYSYAGTAASFLYDKTTPIQERLVKIDVVVGNTENLTVVIDSSIIHPTMAEVEARLDEHDKAPDAHKDIRTAISNAGIAILQRSKTYAVGDIAYSKRLPSWARLECVRAGTTGAPEPTSLATVTKAGQLITDGNAVWIIDDVRDGARVGDIILRPTLRDGYIKANGATVKASEYPRLLAWVQESNMTVTAEQYQTDCSKYVYDAAQDKLTLPNVTGRVLQGGESVKSVEAGLPQHTHVLNGWVGGATPKKSLSNGGYTVVDVASANRSAGADNPIYGASETVQPPAISLIAQIKY